MKVALLTIDSREHFKDYGTPRPYFGTAPEALLQGFARTPGVEVDVVCCLRQPVPTPTRIAPNIRYHALVVPRWGWMSSGYLGCIRAVRGKLRELRPDIVHGQGTERDCAVEAIFSGYPNVLTIHGNMRLIAEVNGAKRFSYAWLNARLEAFTLPRAAGVVCITNYTREAVRPLARRTWLLPNAVDERFFDVAPAPTTPPVVLCVGLVSHRKNQNRFIRALDALAARRPLRAVFLGHIPDDAYGREFRELLRTRPWGEHGGFAGRDELRTHFAGASVVALPSLEDNCPMVVLEAMAAGVPVVAANVGGVPDLVAPDRTGLLFDCLDEAGMREAVAAILDDPARAACLAQTAREEARARFHPGVVAARHLEIYREVLRGAS